MNESQETAVSRNVLAVAADESTLAFPKSIDRYRIEKVLGKGGFGVVYLAHDEQLQRLVAIKVPHANLIRYSTDAEVYLTEARTVASLDHPNIVPVFDAGSSEQFPCFIVSKYIDGVDLATKLKEARPSVHDSLELVATIAESLQHAHKHGLVHRDIKPGNILLDKSGRAYVTDFGLALREQELGKGSRYCGTPAYMSPEQARAEGHRVDGRSDIYSLGVVLYEMLAGRRPFRAESENELRNLITSVEVPPLRQIDELIHKEVERICLKALSIRAVDRYPLAIDMAEDIRHFLAPTNALVGTAQGIASAVLAEESVSKTHRLSEVGACQIMPKGLRSFDSSDADFFLALIPGARDRDGLPDSIRFWKTRIEMMYADQTFSVGLIYGPSGCGKTSLVKAGLLPCLSPMVSSVYIEANTTDTEDRLLKFLRRRVSAMPENLSLCDSLLALRQGKFLPSGRKLLIVLDQFEQWLHVHRSEETSELVHALRQCDGAHLQCILMVRDDFWMSATRFMHDLEINLVERENTLGVDLFPVRHAEKVLAAFGRAFGNLPTSPSDDTQEQKSFILQSVAGLAQEGKVVSVRIALFAEMVKDKQWLPSTLKAIGGIEGVGVTFLEETFRSSTTPPQYRLHLKESQAVLKALLPEAKTDIKGLLRSHQELLDVCGYGNRPAEFDHLIHILDDELRLITPSEPEVKDEADTSLGRTNARYYQLTHDYLVPSLREWLTRKQKETLRGRTELLVTDRAAIWNACREDRQLPTLLQWIQIHLLTKKKNLTLSQRKMMRTANRYHLARTAAVFAGGVLLLLMSWEAFGRFKAESLRDRLLESTTTDVEGIVNELGPFRRWVDPLLSIVRTATDEQVDSKKQLHASLGLVPVDTKQVEYLYKRLLNAEPDEFIVIRRALLNHRQNLVEDLWKQQQDPKNDSDQRFRASCALAEFCPDDPRWEKAGPGVAGALVIQKPFQIPQWTELLKRAGKWLIPPLADFLTDETRNLSERGLIASIYGNYADGVPGAYSRLEEQLLKPNQTGTSSEVKTAQAKRHASLGVALLIMGRADKVWPSFRHQVDPTMRSFLLERLGPGGANADVLIDRLEIEDADGIENAEKSKKEYSVISAILLSLGGFGLDRLPQEQRANFWPNLKKLYQDCPDPSVHGAAESLLRQWGMKAHLQVDDETVVRDWVKDKRRWYLSRHGHTMMIASPVKFWMGEGKERHLQAIDHTFAISSREVTVEQFRQFFKDREYDVETAPTEDCPVNHVTWYEAAEYCNRLSEREGIPEDQWCYLKNDSGKYADGMSMAPGFLLRTGYRLPTEAEWEAACRSGADTMFSFGDAEELLVKYGWFYINSGDKTHPVGMLKPNDLGLWDMHGNVREWVQDAYKERSERTSENAREDAADSLTVSPDDGRLMRGGARPNSPSALRCSSRYYLYPSNTDESSGFRVARTLPVLP